VCHNLAAFRRLSGDERRLLLCALALMPLAQAMVKILPLPRLMSFFDLQTVAAGHEPDCSPEKLAAVASTQKVFRLIERKFPFWPGKCFAQALVARSFLRRQGVPCLLILGAKQFQDKRQQSLQAHAWLKVGGGIVTGGCQPSFIPVAFFI
jgi:hypothetical protein